MLVHDIHVWSFGMVALHWSIDALSFKFSRNQNQDSIIKLNNLGGDLSDEKNNIYCRGGLERLILAFGSISVFGLVGRQVLIAPTIDPRHLPDWMLGRCSENLHKTHPVPSIGHLLE
mmetsp:Transcript_9906/g.20475  ORF Transcript_9906/g.20475 Transcript_9906/m.20475 type:complete len:117 (-) Transcript_9906:29-379(-)